MTAVQHWAGSVCCVVLVSSIVQFFLPQNRLSRSVRLILGLLLLLSILSPLAGSLKEIDWKAISVPSNEFETKNYTELYNREILNSAEKNIQKIIVTELRKEGIDFENIQVETDIDDDNCIFMKQIRISIPVQQADKTEMIREKIESTLDIPTEVEYFG